MPGKGHSPEQVLNKLRQVEVAVAGDASTVGSTSTRQASSRSLSRKTPG